MVAPDVYRDVSALIRENRLDAALVRIEEWLEGNPNDEIGLSLKGSALLRAQRTDEAIAVFRRAVHGHPGSFAAHGDLGFACLQAGKVDEALREFRKAVVLNERFFQGWCYLSHLLFEAGELEDAQTAFQRAEACDPLAPEFPAVQAAMQAERYAEAEKLSRQLLARQPGWPRAAYTLAKLASQVGAFDEAAGILVDAIRRFPCDINLRAALVVSLEDSGRYATAVEEARRITDLDPDNPSSWLILGRVHGHCGNYPESLACYTNAQRLASDTPSDPAKVDQGNIDLLRGHVLKILGRYDEGIEAYRSAIRRTGSNGAGWWGLADMKTYRFSDEDIGAMRQIAEDESVKPEQRAQAAFALGKAFEDRRQYDEAFSRYRLGNELRTGVSFDPQVQQQGVDEIRRAFDAKTLATQASPSRQGPTPVFIVGLPRSGSTLIEQILASHSAIEGTMELATLPNIVRRISIAGGKRNLRYPMSIASFRPHELAAWGQAYLDDTAMYRSGKPLFIDKLPTNFDKVGLIHMILPQAVIIDARRHPLDCGFSCYKQHFAGGHPFSYDLANIGHYYNAYLELMDHWDAVLPGKVLCMRYESVVGDTEGAVRQLLAHCEVGFEDACLRFFENRRPVRTASSEQVRQPIYRRGVGQWRNFEAHLGALTNALGKRTLSRFSED